MTLDSTLPVRILVADDEPDMLRICSDVLKSQFDSDKREPEVHNASNGIEVREVLLGGRFDLIILDVKMPGVSGLELMHFALEHGHGAPVVLITAFPNYSDAITAIREGAQDYIIKPFTAAQLVEVAKRALVDGAARPVGQPVGRSAKGALPADALLGEGHRMHEVRSLLKRVAPLRENVVLLGETGTGKGLVARILHQMGPDPSSPMMTLDCGAIPRELMESELFGHEKGAFTGATVLRKGLLELAEDGTLLLDEVSEIPLELQSRLLRALQEREFRRVGGDRMKHFNARVIAATNRDLEEAVRQGRFRDDLFYRLHVIPIHLPALREHPEDIRLLTTAFLVRFGEQNPNWKVRSISSGALDVFNHYPWPGNVRELENVIRRVAAFTNSEEIRTADLPAETRREATANEPSEGDFNRVREQWLSRFEEGYFRSLLEQTAGNVVEAARSSGVPRASLYRYLRKYGLAPADFRVSNTTRNLTRETPE